MKDAMKEHREFMAKKYGKTVGGMYKNNTKNYNQKNILYVIKSSTDNVYKIGHSRDHESCRKRFSLIKCYSPVVLNLFIYIYCEDSPRLEKQLHGLFREQRLHGEWFRLNIEEKTKMIQFISETTGIKEVKQHQIKLGNRQLLQLIENK